MSSSTATAVTTTWKIDPAHSHVEFSVKHLMIATVRGRFAGVEGSVRLDEADPSAARVDVKIDVSSIDTREAQRDAHLRSADFFDVAAYPTLTFVSSRVAPKRDGEFNVTGTLTIHGVAREVTLPVTYLGRTKDPWGNERVGFESEVTINRKDFGLGWNAVLEAGGLVVGDDVKITLSVQAIADKD